MNKQATEVLQAVFEDGKTFSDIQRDSYLPECPKIPANLQQADDQIWRVLFDTDPTNRDTFAHPVQVWEKLKKNAWAAGHQQCADMSQAKDFFGYSAPDEFMNEVAYVESLLEGK